MKQTPHQYKAIGKEFIKWRIYKIIGNNTLYIDISNSSTETTIGTYIRVLV
jgi:hypothetical protein